MTLQMLSHDAKLDTTFDSIVFLRYRGNGAQPPIFVDRIGGGAPASADTFATANYNNKGSFVKGIRASDGSGTLGHYLVRAIGFKGTTLRQYGFDGYTVYDSSNAATFSATRRPIFGNLSTDTMRALAYGQDGGNEVRLQVNAFGEVDLNYSNSSGELTAANIANNAIDSATFAADFYTKSLRSARTAIVDSATGVGLRNGSFAVGGFVAGAITAAAIADAAIDSSTFAADVRANLFRRNVHSGAAAGATATTITLAANSFADNEINGDFIHVASGTGAGQTRRIIGFVASTEIATVDSNFVTTPTGAVYMIYPEWTHRVAGGTATISEADKVDIADRALQRKRGEVLGSPAPTTTTFSSAAISEAVNFWNDNQGYFIFGANVKGQVYRITASTAGPNGQLTITPALTSAPTAGDSFAITGILGEAPGAGATDWTGTEKNQIRKAMGIDGDHGEPTVGDTTGALGYLRGLRNNTVGGDGRALLSNSNLHGGTSFLLTGERMIFASTTTNQPAWALTGNGSGPGMIFSGGSAGEGAQFAGFGSRPGIRIVAGPTGDGINVTGGTTSGDGINVAATIGDGIDANGGGGGVGIKATGQGGGAGFYSLGGASGPGILAQGNGALAGLQATGGSSSGSGAGFLGGGSSGTGLTISGGSPNGTGMTAVSVGSGSGFRIAGGLTGDGMLITGGTTSGDAMNLATTIGDGIDASGNGGGVGIRATGQGAGAGISAVGGLTGGHGINASGGQTSGSGMGLRLVAGLPDGRGMYVTGAGGGDGARIDGGGTGVGVQIIGGGISGSAAGLAISGGQPNGIGMSVAGTGAGGGFLATSGTGTGFTSQGGTSGHGMSLAGGSASGAGLNLVGGGGGYEGLKVGAGPAGGSHAASFTGTTSGVGIYTTGGTSGQGMRILAGAGSNASGLQITGSGTGNGLNIDGGATSGDGLNVTGGAPNGHGADFRGVGTGFGLRASGDGTGYGAAFVSAPGSNSAGLSVTGGGTGAGLHATGGEVSGIGLQITAGTPNGRGFSAVGAGTGSGFYAQGGATGNGISLVGGSISGDAMNLATTIGDGIDATGNGGGVGIKATGQGSGAGLSVTGGATGSGAAFTGSPGLSVTGTTNQHAVSLAGGNTLGVGLFIAGGSSGTGLEISTNNGVGFAITSGNNSAAEFLGGGSGHGLMLMGHGSGRGLYARVEAAGGTGAGIEAIGAGNSPGFLSTGAGTGAGGSFIGGASAGAVGMLLKGGSTSGAAESLVTTAGHGIAFNVAGAGAEQAPGIASNVADTGWMSSFTARDDIVGSWGDSAQGWGQTAAGGSTDTAAVGKMMDDRRILRHRSTPGNPNDTANVAAHGAAGTGVLASEILFKDSASGAAIQGWQVDLRDSASNGFFAGTLTTPSTGKVVFNTNINSPYKVRGVRTLSRFAANADTIVRTASSNTFDTVSVVTAGISLGVTGTVTVYACETDASGAGLPGLKVTARLSGGGTLIQFGGTDSARQFNNIPRTANTGSEGDLLGVWQLPLRPPATLSDTMVSYTIQVTDPIGGRGFIPKTYQCVRPPNAIGQAWIVREESPCPQ